MSTPAKLSIIVGGGGVGKTTAAAALALAKARAGARALVVTVDPARRLADAGVPIIGTRVDSIEAAEDREKFQQLLHKLGLRQPPNGIARTMDEARREAARIGYPLLVRPSFVLGGRAMEICYDQTQMERFVAEAFIAAEARLQQPDRQVRERHLFRSVPGAPLIRPAGGMN